MKRFIKKLLTLACIVTLISVVPAYLIDPYNVFHWDHVRKNGVEPNRNYIKMKYLLSHKNKYNAFLFGSSRVGSLHVDKITDVKAYNMTYSYGVPTEHLQNLKSLIDGGVEIKRVYLGVDAVIFEDTEEGHRNAATCSYEYLKANPDVFVKLYCNPFMVAKSLTTVFKPQRIHSTFDQLYKNGWWIDYSDKPRFNWSKIGEAKRDKTKEMPFVIRQNMKKTLSDIKEISDVCRQNNIEFIVFTNPIHKVRHINALNKGYLEFLKELATITPFYNFGGINDITVNNENYIDAGHFNAYIGDKMLEVMTKGIRYPKLYEQGFGWYVTSENISVLLDKLEYN